jgi:hypothetical protein
MDEYDLSTCGEDNIRLSSKISAVKAESVTDLVQKPPNGNFWLGVASSHAAHYSATLLFRSGVSHRGS